MADRFEKAADRIAGSIAKKQRVLFVFSPSTFTDEQGVAISDHLAEILKGTALEGVRIALMGGCTSVQVLPE